MSTKPTIHHSLRDKTVLVTGGAQGIGAATVELFVRQGSRVLFIDIDTSAAQSLIDHITALSQATPPPTDTNPPIHTPQFYHCDLTDLPSLQSTAAQILAEHNNTVHILINNAAAPGTTARQSTPQITPTLFDANIHANLRHIFFLTQALTPGMIAATSHGQSCSIVNLGSITWRIPDPSTVLYATCKAAIVGLTRTQSKEFGPHGVRVNSVVPGAVATQHQKEQIYSGEKGDYYHQQVMAAQSLKRDIQPVEVARLVVFLASDDASAITGSSYVVDAGWCSDI